LRKADFTVRGLVAELAERGLKVDSRTMWEFVDWGQLCSKLSADDFRSRGTRCDRTIQDNSSTF
jgi:hypothetical protein